MRSFHSNWCEDKLFPGLCEVQNCFVYSSLVFPPLTLHIFFLRHVQTNTQLKPRWDPFAELQSSFYIECPLFHCFALQFVAALNAISVFSTRHTDDLYMSSSYLFHGNCLLAVSWWKCRAHLVCFWSLWDPTVLCCLLSDVWKLFVHISVHVFSC